MIPIELKKRYPHSREEDITDAFMRGYQACAAQGGDAEMDNCQVQAPQNYMQSSRHDDGRMTKEEAIRIIGWLKCTTNREDDLEAIDMAIEALSAEAVQGEWTYLSGSKGSYMTISCPICGSTFDGVAEWEYHYCPNCGAKMKGGEQNDD